MRFKRFNVSGYVRKTGIPYYMADLLKQTSVECFVECYKNVYGIEKLKRILLACVAKQLEFMIVDDRGSDNE